MDVAEKVLIGKLRSGDAGNYLVDDGMTRERKQGRMYVVNVIIKKKKNIKIYIIYRIENSSK